MEAVLSIAGSDPSGGAGIQADIKTIAAHDLFAETAITVLTVQNTTGVRGIGPVEPVLVANQIDVVFDDIRPAAVKVGVIPTVELIRVVAESLVRNGAERVVVDPVMVATSGSSLADEPTGAALRELLFPLATVVTPNIPEAEALCGFSIVDEAGVERAARELSDGIPGAVLVKGGHGVSDANDCLCRSGGEPLWFRGERVATGNTHGTGCTLSSAIACGLAVGCEVEEAVFRAKRYVTGALSTGLDLGRGSGPLDHMWERFQR